MSEARTQSMTEAQGRKFLAFIDEAARGDRRLWVNGREFRLCGPSWGIDYDAKGSGVKPGLALVSCSADGISVAFKGSGYVMAFEGEK